MDVKITFDRYNVIEADKINDVKVVMVKGEKGDVGYPTDAQVETAVDEWLTAHPEVTTTVQDGAITEAKLANDVKGMFDEKADAIIKTSSGDIASFTDGSNGLLVKSLIANIVPKQSGSGDPSPSNVRPISGYTDVNVTRCGKNLIDEANCVIYNRYLREVASDNHDWAEASDSASVTIKCKPNTTYTISLHNANATFMRASWVDYDPATVQSGQAPQVYGFINRNPYANITITTGATAKYLIVQSNLSILGQRNSQIQIEEGLTATDYEPYNGTSYPISLGQTVYGGTLEVMSGKLTITKGYVNYDGSNDEAWSFISGRVIIFVADTHTGSYNWDFLSNYLKPTGTPQSLPSEWQANFNNNGAFLIGIPTSIADVSSWRTYLSNNNLQICYELATPTEITLTPTQVKTLLGNNNIWSDSGTVEVEYRADTTLAYNELLSLIASL